MSKNKMMDEEKKYDDLIATLKNLQKVKAHPNFEADLKRRLNAEKHKTTDERNKKRYWVPSRLVPAFGLAVAAIVVFLLVDLNSEESDNPFLIEPRVREDLIEVTNHEPNDVPMRQQSENKDQSKERMLSDKKSNEPKLEKRFEEKTNENSINQADVISPESTSIEETEIAATDEPSTELATGIAIRTSGLNFRQINQTAQEKEQISELKKKVQIVSKMKEEK